MEIVSFVENSNKLSNMAFALERLQKKQKEFNDDIENEYKTNPYNKQIENQFYDIMDILFKEMKIDMFLSDLCDEHDLLGDKLTDVLWDDGDIISFLYELEEVLEV